MDKFQCLFYDGDTGLIKDANNQIVMEASRVKANFGMKEFYKKHYFQVGSVNIRNYKRYNKFISRITNWETWNR